MRLLMLILLFPCALAAQPEMQLLRSGAAIADEGTDAINNTGSSPFNITWTIRNDGTSDLSVTGITISAETNCTVTVLSPPATPVAGSGMTTTFTLQVSPIASAEFSFVVGIPNDDADENPYNFTFNGHTSTPSSKGGGSGGGDSGCSTDESHSVFVILALFGLALALLRPINRIFTQPQ
ncbi:MAG: hypothetical protein K8I27_02650 [Planctomycetes bacterium]|nr:hypothetical protein [Planctomycetota bacterium]